jgi:hypothetical protein
MRMALVVIIVVAWVVILIPGFLRRRSAGDATGSISHFHRQLRILEHSAPKPIVAPAYRLRADGGVGPSDAGRTTGPPTLTVVGARDLPRPALAFLAEDPPLSPASPASGPVAEEGTFVGIVSPPDAAGRTDAMSRRLARRRRRDTLGVLILATLASFMIGFLPGASVAWVATAIFGVALAAYVALLVRLRRLAEERERKLLYLRPPDAGSFAGLAGLAALMEADEDRRHGVSAAR